MNSPQARKTQPTVMDVWEWPEFRALAQRLGIRLDVDCLHLSIILDGPSNPVQVIHKYACNDEGPIQKVSPYPPMVSDDENPQEVMENHRAGECHADVHIFEGMKIKCQCGGHSRRSPRDTTPYVNHPYGPDLIR